MILVWVLSGCGKDDPPTGGAVAGASTSTYNRDDYYTDCGTEIELTGEWRAVGTDAILTYNKDCSYTTTAPCSAGGKILPGIDYGSVRGVLVEVQYSSDVPGCMRPEVYNCKIQFTGSGFSNFLYTCDDVNYYAYTRVK